MITFQVPESLRGANLRWVDLHGADLSCADLRSVNLCGADLSGADLSWVDLRGADLSEANLNGANLWDIQIDQTTRLDKKWHLVCQILGRERLRKGSGGVQNVDLSYANFRGASFPVTNFRGTNFNFADLREVDFCKADLSTAKFHGADLSDADLSDVNLSGAELYGAVLNRAKLPNTKLEGATLDRASLHQVDLINANLIRASLEEADLTKSCLVNAQLNGANLSKAILVDAILSSSNLTNANLTAANLTGANLVMASLVRAQFTQACLKSTDLTRVSAGEADFSGAELTGACIQEWSIGFSTKLDDLTCSYIYLRSNWEERRPSDPSQHFLQGEFNTLVQQSLHTVDLIFVDGIDWKAFFISFQELRTQYADEDLSIQAIEKKSDGAFVIRLEVSSKANKAAIESQAKELYERDRQLLETQYQALLQAKDGQIMVYQEWLKAERQDNTNLTGIVKIMAEKEASKVTQHFNAQVTGVAGNVEGSQYINNLQGANIANFANQLRDSASQNASQFSQTIGQNADQIARLITTLREQAHQFPDDQRDAAQLGLDDLQQDLNAPNKVEPKRIKQRLISLLMVLSILGTTIATAADFTNNVLELADKFGVRRSELLQYIPTHILPPIN